MASTPASQRSIEWIAPECTCNFSWRPDEWGRISEVRTAALDCLAHPFELPTSLHCPRFDDPAPHLPRRRRNLFAVHW
jgi:hypothetical protein